MTDPPNPNTPKSDSPPITVEVDSLGLMRTPDGVVCVVIMLLDQDNGAYLVPMLPATAEALTSRLSALTKSAYWVRQGGETLEPIIDMA